jgi:plastocyanin
MKRTALVAVLAAAALVAAVLPAAAATPSFSGTVGPGFTILLAKKPTKAGLTKFTIADKATSHNFHLYKGTGSSLTRVFQVSKTGKPLARKAQATTDVAAVGTKTFYVKLQKGTYTFLCDPHLTSMRGTFTVR